MLKPHVPIINTHFMVVDNLPVSEPEYEFYFEFSDITEHRTVVIFWGRRTPFCDVITSMQRYFERDVIYKPLKGIHTPLMEFA